MRVGKTPTSLAQLVKPAVPSGVHPLKPGFALTFANASFPLAYAPSTSNTGNPPVPLTAMALMFLDPKTRPIPVLPACRPKSWEMQANRTPFSPAGPMVIT